MEVQSLLKDGAGWTVSAKERESGDSHTFQTSKLIVASGLASIPNMPLLPGKATFDGPIIHQENFGSSNILSAPEIKIITVLGGGKSSGDMV